jgi:hypothetical protein
LIKSKEGLLGWVRYYVYGQKKNEYRCLTRRLEGRRPLGDLGVEGRIVLKRFLKE